MKKLIISVAVLCLLVVAFVLLKDTKETSVVKVYFNNSKLDPEITCVKTFPIERIIPKTSGLALAALTELLQGPTAAEISEKYQTSIPPGVKINSLKIENGTAYADFDGTLEKEVGGSCRVLAIRSQITSTLKEFSTVQEVVISINGRIEDILQP